MEKMSFYAMTVLFREANSTLRNTQGDSLDLVRLDIAPARLAGARPRPEAACATPLPSEPNGGRSPSSAFRLEIG